MWRSYSLTPHFALLPCAHNRHPHQPPTPSWQASVYRGGGCQGAGAKCDVHRDECQGGVQHQGGVGRLWKCFRSFCLCRPFGGWQAGLQTEMCGLCCLAGLAGWVWVMRCSVEQSEGKHSSNRAVSVCAVVRHLVPPPPGAPRPTAGLVQKDRRSAAGYGGPHS